MTTNCRHITCEGETCRREKPQRKIYRIRKVSKKREGVNREYFKRSRIFRKANPLCAIKAEGCSKLTEGVHHMRGKENLEKLMDENYWLPACNRCNNYCESHSAWARENGFKLSKHEPINK